MPQNSGPWLPFTYERKAHAVCKYPQIHFIMDCIRNIIWILLFFCIYLICHCYLLNLSLLATKKYNNITIKAIYLIYRRSSDVTMLTIEALKLFKLVVFHLTFSEKNLWKKLFWNIVEPIFFNLKVNSVNNFVWKQLELWLWQYCICDI